jgi:hypothetical protein
VNLHLQGRVVPGMHSTVSVWCPPKLQANTPNLHWGSWVLHHGVEETRGRWNCKKTLQTSPWSAVT